MLWKLNEIQVSVPQIKFHWNIAALTYSRIVYDCFYATVAEVVATDVVLPAKTNTCIVWPFTENVCWSRVEHLLSSRPRALPTWHTSILSVSWGSDVILIVARTEHPQRFDHVCQLHSQLSTKEWVPGTVLGAGEFSSEQNGYSFLFQEVYMPKGRKANSKPVVTHRD